MNPAPDPYYPLDVSAVPGRWAAAPLGDWIGDLRPGSASGTHSADPDGGVAHLRPFNIDRHGKLDLAQVKYVPPRAARERLAPGDVLFNNTNSLRLVGRAAVVNVPGEWAFSNHMTRLRAPEGLSPALVAHQLNFLWAAGYFRRKCVNHVNQASVSAAALADSVPLLVPPRAEQDRIVAEIERQFTRLDSAVAALKRVQANLKRHRASVLKAACEGRLVPTEAELARREGRSFESGEQLLARILKERRAKWQAQSKKPYKEPAPPDTSALPPLPEGWAWTALAQVSEVQGGVQKQPRRSPVQNAFPYLAVANVYRGRLDLSRVGRIELFGAELARLRLRPGDLLIVEGNGSPTEVGRMAVWGGEIPDCVHQNHVIRARPAAGLVPEFCAAFWNSLQGARAALRVASSTSGLHTLSAHKASRLPVPIAPTSEQNRMVAEVGRLLSGSAAAEAGCDRALARAERLRQSILKRAFEGKLVPQDPTDEPASALLDRIRRDREAAGEPRRRPRRRAAPTHA